MDLLKKINQSLGAAEKNQEKVKAICTTSFSVLASQSVESSFAGKTKIQMLTTSCRSMTLPIRGLFKSLRLYVPILFIMFLPGRKNSSNYTFVYKELLITGSEFPLSGFFLAVVCTVKPWEQSRKKLEPKNSLYCIILCPLCGQ